MVEHLNPPPQQQEKTLANARKAFPVLESWPDELILRHIEDLRRAWDCVRGKCVASLVPPLAEVAEIPRRFLKHRLEDLDETDAKRRVVEFVEDYFPTHYEEGRGLLLVGPTGVGRRS